MRKLFLLPLLLATAVSASDSFTRRVQEAQKALISNGPSFDLLSDYELLVIELRSETMAPASAAQVFYQKALVEISLNKASASVTDLGHALDLDPTFRPAATKLIDVFMSRGQFDEIRARFDQSTYPETYLDMGLWEQAWETINKSITGQKTISDEVFQYFDDVIFKYTPELVQAYELHLRCLKTKLQHSAIDARGDIYSAIVTDYSRLVKYLPQRNLAYYAELAQYLLYTRGNYQDSFSVVKTCLRMDHDYKPCATLSKFYSRMQSILKAAEDYFIRDEYLYHAGGDQVDILKEKLDSFEFDWVAIQKSLSGELKVPKRELKSLPSFVTNNYQYLTWQAQEFAEIELGNKKAARELPFVQSLNKLYCESSVNTRGDVKSSCGDIDESKEKFFPKHVNIVDSYLKKGNLHEARQILSQFNQNVQKTDIFQKRWEPIQREEERERIQQQQRQQQQQQEFFQQQQRQKQQQQQQSHMDRSKDYYKVLGISKDADDKTIRKAYRSQTLKFHPDKYKGSDLSEQEIENKMQEINEAYEVLSNPQAKQDYDNGPHEQQGGFHQQHHYGGGGMQFQFNADDFAKRFHQGGFQFHF